MAQKKFGRNGPRGLNRRDAENLALKTTIIQLKRELAEARKIIEQGHWADPLTGLASRMRLEEETRHHFGMLRRQINSCEPPDHFSMIFCDGNNFGQINKDFGHLVGDAVLKEVADYLCASTREGDIVARFAGDEYVILAPNTTYEQSKQLMGKIYDGLRDFPFQNGPGKLTLSTGSASTSEGLDTLEALLTTADMRMLARKRKKKVKD